MLDIIDIFRFDADDGDETDVGGDDGDNNTIYGY